MGDWDALWARPSVPEAALLTQVTAYGLRAGGHRRHAERTKYVALPIGSPVAVRWALIVGRLRSHQPNEAEIVVLQIVQFGDDGDGFVSGKTEVLPEALSSTRDLTKGGTCRAWVIRLAAHDAAVGASGPSRARRTSRSTAEHPSEPTAAIQSAIKALGLSQRAPRSASALDDTTILWLSTGYRMMALPCPLSRLRTASSARPKRHHTPGLDTQSKLRPSARLLCLPRSLRASNIELCLITSTCPMCVAFLALSSQSAVPTTPGNRTLGKIVARPLAIAVTTG